MNKKIILNVGLILFISYQNLFAQTNNHDEVYEGLRKIVLLTSLLHPMDSSFNKYLGYSYEIWYRKDGDIAISYTENAPMQVKKRKSYVEKKIVDYLEQEAFRFDDEIKIVYPILHIWRDKIEREDNIISVFEAIFGEKGKSYQGSIPIRIEKPIITYLLEPRI